MADEPTPVPESGPAGAPAPGHDPNVIEGEATELYAAEGETSPSEATSEFAPTEAPYTPADPADFTSTETTQALADFASTEAPPQAPAEPDEPPPWAEPPRERTSGGSFVWGICGVVVGAAVALGGAWYFDPRGEPLRDLGARQSALDAGAAAQSAATKGLDARIGALESAQAGFAKTAALEPIDKRLAAVEAAEAAPAKPVALDAIEQRLAKLESGAVDPEAITAAQKEARAAREDAAKALAQAAAAGRGSEPPTPAPGPDPRIGELSADETALGGRIDKLEAALAARIAKIEAALAAPKAETRAPQTETAPKVDAAGQAIAALALEQRLTAGQPFAAEWAALSRLGADGAALATLKPLSDTGAPTAAALAASFAKIAPGLVAVADNPEIGDGVVDRMLDHMRKLVRVRAVGEIAGDDPAALVSQIEAALARGQVVSALGVYARLPEAARKEGADWAGTVNARIAADAAAQSLRESAIGKLAAAKN